MQNQTQPNNEAGAVAQERLVLPLESVAHERRRQDEKWGVQNHDPITWSVILTEECGEFAQAALHHRFGSPAAAKLRNEAVQVAAVAVAIIEYLDRNSHLVGCALCDRGDGMLGHADNCPNREPQSAAWVPYGRGKFALMLDPTKRVPTDAVALVKPAHNEPGRWFWEHAPWMGQWGMADSFKEAKDRAGCPWKSLWQNS